MVLRLDTTETVFGTVYKLSLSDMSDDNEKVFNWCRTNLDNDSWCYEAIINCILFDASAAVLWKFEWL